MKTLSLFFSIAILNCFCACTYYKGEEAKPSASSIPCDTSRVIKYSGDVAPFLVSSCGSTNVSCHNSSASSMIPLDVYVGVQYYGQTGQLMNCLNWTGPNWPSALSRSCGTGLRKVRSYRSMPLPSDSPEC